MMATTVKKTISLSAELAKKAEDMARAQGKTLSAIVQEALRHARATRLKNELRHLQGYWARKAEGKGLFTEQDLERYLRRTHSLQNHYS
jgi:predicted transcriptional regulator